MNDIGNRETGSQYFFLRAGKPALISPPKKTQISSHIRNRIDRGKEPSISPSQTTGHLMARSLQGQKKSRELASKYSNKTISESEDGEARSASYSRQTRL